MTGPADQSAGSGRGPRTRLLAIALVLLGAGLTWASSRAGWITMQVADGLQPPRPESVIGATWAAELAPIALAMGAAVVALLVVRGSFYRVVGVVIGALALAVGVAATRSLVAGAEMDRVRQLEALPARAEIAELAVVWWAPGLALAGALAALAGAVLAVVVPLQGKAASGRYQTPSARRDDARAVLHSEGREGAISGGAAAGIPLDERLLWDALDAGEDPTASADEGPEKPGSR